MARSSEFPMVSMSDAFAKVLAYSSFTVSSEIIPLHTALGRTAAADVLAKEPLPPFDASIMDGYAVLSRDGIGDLDVLGRATAGVDPDWEVPHCSFFPYSPYYYYHRYDMFENECFPRWRVALRAM